MRRNYDKCKIEIERPHYTAIHNEWNSFGLCIPSPFSLGVELSSKRIWSYHVKNIIGKAWLPYGRRDGSVVSASDLGPDLGPEGRKFEPVRLCCVLRQKT